MEEKDLEIKAGETEETDIPWYATLAGIAASFGTGYVINNVIKNISTIPGSFKGKILFAIGTAGISGAISNIVSRETEKDVAAVGEFISKAKRIFCKE